MNRALIIAKREYAAAVRTKGFLISLLLLPIFMGGGLVAFAIMKDKVDITEKKLVVLDRSGRFGDFLKSAAEDRNKNWIFNDQKEQIAPLYQVEILAPDTVNPDEQKLELSNRVRNKEINAFAQIGREVVHPIQGNSESQILYYSENSAIDNMRGWLNEVMNNKLREVRLLELGVDAGRIKDLFYWVNAEGMSLVSVESSTGKISGAKKTNEMQTIFVPYILLLLMFMMVMMSAVPLLNSVMEEKSERIAEVLLGTCTPSEFMMGKVIGSLGVAFTTSAIYIIGGIITMHKVGRPDIIPFHVLPWFFVYLFLNITMVGTVMAALGATCNDSKDAQSMQFPAMLPLIIPLFFMMPVIMDPLGKLATGLSLFPLWTPMLMLLRQSTSVTIPLWQPIVGLVGVVLFTGFFVWAGARVFRASIILHGKRPKFGTLVKYVVKG
ncbi:MAG: ABC transporter permease [Bacteroidales bacterium]